MASSAAVAEKVTKPKGGNGNGKISSPQSASVHSSSSSTGKSKQGRQAAVNDNTLKWVQCDKCCRWHIYESTLLAINLGPYDVDKLKTVSFKCDLCCMQETVELVVRENVQLKEEISELKKEIMTRKETEIEIEKINQSIETVKAQKSPNVSVEKEQEIKEYIDDRFKSYSEAVVRGEASGTIMQNGNLDTETVSRRDLKDLVEATMAKRSKEDVDQNNRRCNIIIYRVPESKASNAKDRVEEDLCFLNGLVSEALQLNGHEVKIVKQYRLGKQEAGTGLASGTEVRVRPLLVKFGSAEMKDIVMANVKKLKNAAGRYKAISIAHDLTPQQREKLKAEIQKEKERATCGGTPDQTQENYQIRVVGPPEQLRVIRRRKLN